MRGHHFHYPKKAKKIIHGLTFMHYKNNWWLHMFIVILYVTYLKYYYLENGFSYLLKIWNTRLKCEIHILYFNLQDKITSQSQNLPSSKKLHIYMFSSLAKKLDMQTNLVFSRHHFLTSSKPKNTRGWTTIKSSAGGICTWKIWLKEEYVSKHEDMPREKICELVLSSKK
jgi:hypothetical protein